MRSLVQFMNNFPLGVAATLGHEIESVFNRISQQSRVYVLIGRRIP